MRAEWRFASVDAKARNQAAGTHLARWVHPISGVGFSMPKFAVFTSNCSENLLLLEAQNPEVNLYRRSTSGRTLNEPRRKHSPIHEKRAMNLSGRKDDLGCRDQEATG